jgi:hypothetical protein
VAINSLEQDRSECQIEWQTRASKGLSRACECPRGLVFSWSTCPTCSDPKNSVRRLRGSSPRLSRAARSGDRDRDARRQDRHPAGGPPRAASAVRGGQGTCQPGAEHRVSVLRHLGYEVIPPPEPRQGHHRRSGNSYRSATSGALPLRAAASGSARWRSGPTPNLRAHWSQLSGTKKRDSSAVEKCYPNINSTILSHVTRRVREDHSEGQFGGHNAASES